jgi:signal transduction histidine kinase
MIPWIAAHRHLRTFRYAISILALALAATLTWAIIHFKLPLQFTGYGFLLVIIGSAWWGGYGPGLLTTAITLLFGPYLTSSTYTIRHPRLIAAPQVLIISVLISRMAAIRQTLREANEKLDERVRQRTAELELANRALLEREAQLMAQSEKLSESNADLEQFAYFASHDLQEPLRMIAIYTQLIEETCGPVFDEETRRHTRLVRESVRRMEALVNDLLMYSRAIHSDRMERSEVDPQEAIGVAMANLKPQIDALNAEVIASDLPRLVANPVQLIQIFQNLFSNALKYRGADPPRISVTASAAPDEWIICVRDNGIGIHPDYHEKIFIPFKRLHGQQYPGSGVGLAICRRIVERLGGRIWVESEAGRGAAFFFSIPTSPQPEPMPQDSAVAAI